MNNNVNVIAKKALKVTGAAAAATGVVALSALVASGAAVGAVVEGFKAAGSTFKEVMKKEEKKADATEGQEIQIVDDIQEVSVEAQEV